MTNTDDLNFGPPLAGVSPTDTVAKMAEGLLGFLRLARALVASGRPLELDGVQDLIGRLCAKALDLPLVEGRLLRDTLRQMDEELAALMAEMPRS